MRCCEAISKAFLAGALEATTSYASWAIAPPGQKHRGAGKKYFQEVKDIEDYTPQALD